MRKIFYILVIGFMFGMLYPINDIEAKAPCPTGYNHVSKSWFKPFNTEAYTMCGCQVEYGTSADGNCIINDNNE